MKRLLSKAIKLAANFHASQFDKAGEPYFLHCIKVMHYLKTNDEELQCIAILHDIIEDTKCTDIDLEEAGMTKRIIDGIVSLTKSKDISIEDYLNQILKNKDAIKVKMADLRHNSDIRRLKKIRQKDFDRIVKYHQMYQELKNVS